MKDLMNDFEVWQEALKKIDLSEGALPVYHGRILRENAKEYQKMQKILNCPEMIKCHKYIFDLDPEQLDESDCTKINNLYKLGVDRGFIEDTVDVPDEDMPEVDYTAGEEAAATEQPKPYVAPQHAVRVPCYTVMYSATKDGEVKTGESYSNATNPRAAKADVYAKLSNIGYDNIAILAIECGDPDAASDSTYTFEDDILQNRVHNGHFLDEEDAEKKEDKPAEDKPAEDKPAEKQSTEDKPAEDKPAEDKPAEASAEEQPAEDKPAEDKPAEEQPAEDKPAEDKPAEEQPAEDKPAEEQPAEDKPAEEQPAEEQADDSKEELDDNKKAELKDEYRKTFKNVMTKCQFENRCFDDLTIAEKVQFFTAMASSWTKNEPNEFMTDKEIEQLNKIVIEN